MGSRRRGLPVLLLSFGFAAACASRSGAPPKSFAPADEATRTRALSAWREALRRADSLPPSRLLYDAKFGRGAVRAPGTLAVVAGRGGLTASATGPFGGEVGTYENGKFKGKEGEIYLLDPDLLRGVLAGVWRDPAPEVAGADAREGLLRWSAEGGVVAEGVLDLEGAKLRSLSVRGPRGTLTVAFSGAFDPWPEVVALEDARSGRSLRLRRVAVEPIEPR